MSLSWIRQVGWDEAPRELSVRTECHGGEILESALEHPADQLARSRSVILLIHGFNVSLCSAGKSYEAFLKEVRSEPRGPQLFLTRTAPEFLIRFNQVGEATEATNALTLSPPAIASRTRRSRTIDGVKSLSCT